MYAIITVAADPPEAEEPLGSKGKFWYADRKFLFKQIRPGTGEDWAEKVSAELAGRLGLPHAEYDLGQWDSGVATLRGVCSPNFCPAGGALILGNELLAEADPDYAVEAVSKFRVPAHTVERVMLNLRHRNPGFAA